MLILPARNPVRRGLIRTADYVQTLMDNKGLCSERTGVWLGIDRLQRYRPLPCNRLIILRIQHQARLDAQERVEYGAAPAISQAPVAQLDRALPSEGKGREFESRRVRHFKSITSCDVGPGHQLVTDRVTGQAPS